MSIDLSKILHNSRHVAKVGLHSDIRILGVTKACLGDPSVARAMVAGGLSHLADSRLSNLLRLRQAGFEGDLTMLRQPMRDEVDEVVRTCDAVLISEDVSANWLSRAATSLGRCLSIILMVETGGGREGVPLERLEDRVRTLLKLRGVRLAGIGTNIACLAGENPGPEHLGILVAAANLIESKIGYKLDVVSGGNSSAWAMLSTGSMPSRVNQLRLGEAILLGRETAAGTSIDQTFDDAFLIEGEVIEVKDITGGVFSRNGGRRRLIVALGCQDVGGRYGGATDAVHPHGFKADICKITSDHLVLGVDDFDLKIGSTLLFRPSYFGLLAAMTSPSVQKRYLNLDSVDSVCSSSGQEMLGREAYPWQELSALSRKSS